jgi:hypothetical protein
MSFEPASAKKRAGDAAVFLAPTVAALVISPIISNGVNWSYLVFSVPIGLMAVLGRREGLRNKG